MHGPPRPSVALATATGEWEVDPDGPLLCKALEAEGVHPVPAVWDDHSIDWSDVDLVVVRSTWDYTTRRQQFLEWAERVDSVTSLVNPPTTLRWNTDKRYLSDLAAAGVAVVPTRFIGAGDPPPDEASLPTGASSVVVKPTVSAGARDTARHDRSDLASIREHVADLVDSGGTAMLQPYLGSVDTGDETGMVFIDGELSHAFAKGALLVHGRPTMHGSFAPETIRPRRPADDELELAHSTLEAATTITGTRPVYARVDVLRDDAGEPVLLELELTEPSFFLAHTDAGAAVAARCFARLARAAASARVASERPER